METRTVEQVESWSTRSFANGYAGLRELSDGEFSGAVRAGGAWLFMLNGRIIGIYEGSLDDFEDADGTAYAAPHPSLPLLFSMQEQGGETQAKYYTNDTPLSEVDSTLTDGKFTGFIELSENVLSGDYYVAYYGGRSMSVAFVGASEQVVTGEEAFERAGDEVGIYEVTDVNVEVTDVPDPDGADEEPDAGTTGPSGTTDAADDSGRADTGAGTSPAGGESAASGRDGRGTSGSRTSEAAPDRSSRDQSGSGRASRDQSGPGQASSDQPSASRSTASGSADASGQQDRATAGRSGASTDQQVSETTDAERTADASSSEAVESSPSSRPESVVEEAEPDSDSGASDAPASDDSSTTESNAFSEEAKWRETTTIPSLDPDRSESPDEEADESGQREATPETERRAESPSGGQSRSTQRSAERRQSPGESRTSTARASDASGSSEAASAGASENASGTTETSSGGEEARARIQKLQSQLRQRKQQVEQLKQRVSKLESERDEFERERDALRQEVKRLEAKLDRAESATAGSGDRQLSEAQAFDGTNLFVRYESKGKATLDEAAEGTADADDVNANLRLEHHTQFDAEDVSVDGQSFETFLTDSFEYRFVSWVVEELLYEIRETGHRNGLRNLYSAIPKVDRIDLHGDVNAGGDDEDTRQESFDVIMRDRMGNPLIVADLNGSREPTTGDMMGSLVDAASGVGEAYDELSAAFQVTESFFEPEALETTEAATSGGFLSREKRESFVKLSRKRGYHLSLVESRSGGFHLNVPEL